MCDVCYRDPVVSLGKFPSFPNFFHKWVLNVFNAFSVSNEMIDQEDGVRVIEPELKVKRLAPPVPWHPPCRVWAEPLGSWQTVHKELPAAVWWEDHSGRTSE